MATRKQVEAERERQISRSAKSGRIVSNETAKRNPATTVTEKVKRTPKAKSAADTPIPKQIGAVADMLYNTRQERLLIQKQVDDLEKLEARLKNHLIENLPKSSATGAAGKVARAQIVIEAQPAVEDWDEFYKHIKKKGEFELLNRAVNRTAVKERWENGKTVPGVTRFNVTKVSITKV